MSNPYGITLDREWTEWVAKAGASPTVAAALHQVSRSRPLARRLSAFGRRSPRERKLLGTNPMSTQSVPVLEIEIGDCLPRCDRG
jgi:hypothetical protein